MNSVAQNIGLAVPNWIGWALLMIAGLAVANLHGCA